MDDLLALDGGTAAKRWRKKHAQHRLAIERTRRRRTALDAKERRWRTELKRKARIERVEREDRQRKRRRKQLRKKIERADRKAFLKKRRAEGYTKPGVAYKDLTGKRYGLLVAVKPGGRVEGTRNKMWWVQCDCGSPPKEVRGTNLQQGILRSCGCYGRNGLRMRWHSMKYHANRAARYLETARPVSDQLLKLQKKLGLTGREARLLFQARCWIAWAEAQLGIRKTTINFSSHASGAALITAVESARRAASIVKPRRARTHRSQDDPSYRMSGLAYTASGAVVRPISLRCAHAKEMKRHAP